MAELIEIDMEEPELVSDVEPDPKARLDVILKIAAEGENLLSDEEAAILHAYKRQTGAKIGAEDHYANLAEHMEDSDLYRIGADVCEWARRDDESRAEWIELEREGLEMLGILQSKQEPIVEGGATVVHPILAEACVTFWARAMDALWPAGTPVKTAVVGDITEDKQERATRVEGYMNHLYTREITSGFKQTSKLLMRLPVSGNLFTRPYYDHALKRLERAVITPERFIVPFEADSLETAQRYTEVVPMDKVTVKRMQKAGILRDIELIEPYERVGFGGSDAKIEIEDDLKRAEGREDVEGDEGGKETYERHTVFYCCCNLELPGFPNGEKGDGEHDYALPYMVAVDRDSQKVLAIYRQWRKSDEHKRRLIEYIQHGFIPGLNFYDYSFYHMIGGMAKAATGALRALLDTATWENTQGGLKSEDLKVEGGDIKATFNKWIDVKATAQEMKDGFVPWPKTPPSQTLFNLLGFMVEGFHRFAGTTESIMGEGTSNVPVGTTMARIEQGMKTYTAIQRGLHESFGQEYQRMFELAGLWLPDRYPYAVPGEAREVFKTDFDPMTVDVFPVSDPNHVSNTQRYFVSQASLETAEKAPELYDMREVHRRTQMVLRVEDLDSLMPPPEDLVKRMGPVEENAAALQGLPLKAHFEQDDAAHIQVHSTFLMGLDSETANSIGAPLQAHIREHMANQYLKLMQGMTGVQFQAPSREALIDNEWIELPPEMENQIAMLAAQATDAMAQPQQESPEAAEERRKDEIAAAEQARKDAVAQADIQRKDAVAAADVARKDGTAVADMERKEAESIEERLFEATRPPPEPPEVK